MLNKPKNIYQQKYNDCAIAAIATIANGYNSDYTYDSICEIACEYFITENGMEIGDIGSLLFIIGFKKNIILTTDIDLFDFGLNNKDNSYIIRKMKKRLSSTKDKELKPALECYISFLKQNDDNKIIITNDYKKQIISYLDKKHKIIFVYNWGLFFKLDKSKYKQISCGGAFDSDYHAVVAYDYDKNGVWVADSNFGYSFLKKKYHKPYYFMEWDPLIMSLASGEIIVPLKFRKNVKKNN